MIAWLIVFLAIFIIFSVFDDPDDPDCGYYEDDELWDSN